MALPNYWHEVIERAEGPMKIRLILQPITAALFAIRSGRRQVSPQFPTRSSNS